MEKTCLTVDIGNSATKWAVWSGDEIVALGRVPALSESTVESITAKYGVIDAVAVSCVGSAERIPAIEGALILSASTPLPIDISEYAPGLGADRIAAMAGADLRPPRRRSSICRRQHCPGNHHPIYFVASGHGPVAPRRNRGRTAPFVAVDIRGNPFRRDARHPRRIRYLRLALPVGIYHRRRRARLPQISPCLQTCSPL